MARRVEHVEREALDGECIALGDPHGHDVRLGLLAHHGDAVRAVAQRADPGDVVGVQMRVDRLDELEVELVDELQVALDLLDDRIDDQRLAAAAGRHQIGVGPLHAVVELAKDHGGHPVPGARITAILEHAPDSSESN